MTDRDYDPKLDITAGEFRALGKVLPASIPDCAWVPRAAMRMGEVKATPTGDPSRRGVHVSWSVTFDEPFRWVEVTGTLVDDTTGVR